MSAALPRVLRTSPPLFAPGILLATEARVSVAFCAAFPKGPCSFNADSVLKERYAFLISSSVPPFCLANNSTSSNVEEFCICCKTCSGTLLRIKRIRFRLNSLRLFERTFNPFAKTAV